MTDMSAHPLTTVTLADDPLWYKDAIIYQLHVKAFYDGNNDGIGDFAGLIEKLDYIQDLGVNTLWLLPFYPSPMRDDGYDIADYRNIHAHYGTRRDFRAFIRAAHRRGIRVICELVINHTSDQHPWFQAARKAPAGSPKRDFYVWSDTDKKFPETRIIFSDTETSNWAWDSTAQAYYWHRFFSHQPDLNHNNPHVVRAVTRVMRFWLDQGVDGLRLDAIPYLCVREGTDNENLPESHAVLKEMRRVVDTHYKNRMFLAEANQWPEDVRDYFGNGDECHMAYHFPLMPRMYMGLAQEDRYPITEIMRQTPDIPSNCQWAIFLRNHDELTLEMVTDRERDYMYQMYAADPRMRLNLGIRRRLAPLLENNVGKIELLNSLLLSMPGSPIIYYGDEIGMGDNVFLGDRNGVRTPMQWSPDRNAGFSRADPARLYLPPIMDAVYGYQAVNVEAQSNDRSSLLNWIKRLITVRKAHRAFGRGALEFLRPGNRKILVYLRLYENETILCVANLARSAQPVELDLARFKGYVPVELLGRTAFPPIGDLPYLLTLPGHGFYWFLLSADNAVPEWHQDKLPPAELPVLVLFDGWKSFFPERVAPERRAVAEQVNKQLLHDVLPGFITAQRWFAGKGARIDAVALHDSAAWFADGNTWLFGIYHVAYTAGSVQMYSLPLTLAWEDGDEARLRGINAAAIARVRQRARIGTLGDAFADESFCRALVTGMVKGETWRTDGNGTLCPVPTDACASLIADLDILHAPVRTLTQASNSSAVIGERLFVKGYRRLQPGLAPEVEMGRFLTDVAHFPHCIPLAGAWEYRPDDGESITLAIVQAYTENQGDGWTYTRNYLERYFESCLASVDKPCLGGADAHGGYLTLIRTLGLRTAELHRALATPSGDPAFAAETASADDISAWIARVAEDAADTLDVLAQAAPYLGPPLSDLAATVLAARSAFLQRLSDMYLRSGTVKTRYHGDYHLGQVLLKQNDFVIIDFEGEPGRTIAERRRKHSALRDVAGMLRSFSYAAYALLREMTAGRPADYAGLEPLAKDWEEQTKQVFLSAYRSAIAGCPVYPERAEDGLQLIELFALEKALYELRYELDNRPEWVEIPLRGLLAWLAQSHRLE